MSRGERRRAVLKAVGRAVLLAAVLALAALPALFMNSLYGYLPILAVLALLLLSLICLLALSRGLSVQAQGSGLECRRGESLSVELKLLNRSPVCCARAVAWLYVSDLFGGREELRPVSFAIPGRGGVEFGFGMEMPHVGCFTVGLDRVELCDFFGVFRKNARVSGRFSAVVTPRLRPVEDLRPAENVLTETSRETSTSVVGGTDYTGVRAYVLGDPMKQIHWKLSAHSREYMTKLQESCRQQEFAVVLDFDQEEETAQRRMELNDCLVETALSLVEELAAREAGCALLFTDRTGSPVRTLPAGREDDADLVRSFPVPGAERVPDAPDVCALLRQEAQGQNRASNVAVVTARPTPELLQELLLIRGQRRSPELFFVVPAGWSAREREKACAPLRALDDRGVPWTLVSTELNSLKHGT